MPFKDFCLLLFTPENKGKGMLVRFFIITLLILHLPSISLASEACLSKDDDNYSVATQSLFIAQQYLSSRPGRAIDQAVAVSSIGDDLRQLLQERDTLRQVENRNNAETSDTLAAFERLNEIEKQIEILSPGLLKRLTFNPLSVSQLQEELDDKQALLILLETEQASFGWWIDKTCFRWNRLSQFSKIDAYNQISQLRDGISPNLNIRGVLNRSNFKIKETPFPKAIAKDIHRKVLGGFSDRMKYIQKVSLHTNGSFLSIPFAALIDPATNDYEIKARSYAIVPSLSALSSEGNKIRLSRDSAILAIGAPSYTQNPELQWLGSLPGAETELTNLQSAYPNNSKILSGPSASKMEFLDTVAELSPELLLFSTHAVLDDSLGTGVSGLLMSSDDNMIESAILSPSEIASYPINSKLVILSACNTWAGEDGGKGDALTGLALSFFQAGTKNLIVTHWPIADDSASQWSQILIDKIISNNLATAETLRQSQLQLMKSEDGRWAHPKHWAPYIFVAGNQ